MAMHKHCLRIVHFSLVTAYQDRSALYKNPPRALPKGAYTKEMMHFYKFINILKLYCKTHLRCK